MGLLKGSVTVSRYAVQGELPPDFHDFLDRRIRENLFQEIEDTADELAVGWVSAQDFMDIRLAYAAYALDPYVVLGLRVDRRRVPGTVLKKYFRRELDKALSLREGRKLSHSEREQLKEKARLGLLTRIPPVSQMAEVCWDTSRGEVWLFSSARTTRDLFEDIFRRTFSLNLLPRIPYLLAGDLLGKDGAKRLEAARPLSLYSAGE